MTSFFRRLSHALMLVIAAPTLLVFAADPSDPANLPSPITVPKQRDPGSLDNLGEGPVKAKPYHWLEDDPVSSISLSTASAFVTEIEDVEPNNILERPGLSVGWFSDLELTAANPQISHRLNSGSLLAGTFASPVSVPSVPMDWTVMPKLTLGYRLQEGLGELSASYRFLMSEGTGSIPGFSGGGTGNGTSSLQLHVVDLDYSLADLFPNDLWLMPRTLRITGGIRVAGLNDKVSANGGTIVGQSQSNTFVGAGPRVAIESFYPLLSSRWTVFTKLDFAGVIGSDKQNFSQTTSGGGAAGASASSSGIATAVPTAGVRAGLNWFPEWGDGNVKMSAGYQWERWFDIGSTSSFDELTIQGPFVRGEVAF